MKNSHFILIGNYPLDKQESMNRYTESIKKGLLLKNMEVTIWKPLVFFAIGQKTTNGGIGKWLGYIDKWILFPLIIKFSMIKGSFRNRNVFFHVCDHSNAPYLAILPKERSGITCHDVLAIRGALGYADAYCPASSTGIYLQKWILKNLVKSKRIACVSQFTLDQLLDLAGKHRLSNDKNWTVVHNFFNASFKPMTVERRTAHLQKAGLGDSPYVLHVGSALPRKNRRILVDMVNYMGDGWKGYICFAGQAIEPSLQAHIDRLGLSNRVVSVVKPPHDALLALYSGCDAFVFPSLSEGFGWPLIEAQACGAPVIASNIQPMPEVSGGAALHVNPHRAEEFANAFFKLSDPEIRTKLIKAGLDNCKRFERNTLIDKFIALYK